MTSYIIRRLLLITTVFLALSFLFFLFFALPGDPASLLAGGEDRVVDPGVLERINDRYGLDDPILVQFKDYWARTITGTSASRSSTARASTRSCGRRRSTASAWASGPSSSRSSWASRSASCRPSGATRSATASPRS